MWEYISHYVSWNISHYVKNVPWSCSKVYSVSSLYSVYDTPSHCNITIFEDHNICMYTHNVTTALPLVSLHVGLLVTQDTTVAQLTTDGTATCTHAVNYGMTLALFGVVLSAIASQFSTTDLPRKLMQKAIQTVCEPSNDYVYMGLV